MATIAVFGLNGLLGKPVIEALLREPFISKIKAPIRLITASDKKPIDSPNVKYYNLKEEGFSKPLEGVDAVINLGGVPGSPLDDILKAIVEQKVKLYIPSQFGTDLVATEPTFSGFLKPKTDHSNAARKAGVKTVDVVTGLFIKDDGFFPFGPLFTFSGDYEKTKQAIGRGDANTKVNPSFFKDIGNTVAALVTKDDYSKIPDTIRIYSDEVTNGDLVAHYEKVNNVKLNVKYISPSETIAEAKEKYSKGFKLEDFALYLATLLSEGEGKGLIYEKNNQREFVNPGESLFKWTKYPN